MSDSSFNRRDLIATAGIAAVTAGWWAARPASARATRFPVTRTPAEWLRLLGADRYRVLRLKGTERAGTSPLDKERRRGTFLCAGCNQPLFASATKFDSGTGWPSFYRALPGAVLTEVDRSLLMERDEVLCRRCGGHLGHVFNDGPKPTGLRYCMNGLALKFRAA